MVDDAGKIMAKPPKSKFLTLIVHQMEKEGRETIYGPWRWWMAGQTAMSGHLIRRFDFHTETQDTAMGDAERGEPGEESCFF